MNEAAIKILRDQLASRGADVADVSADEVLERGLDAGLITDAVAETIRGPSAAVVPDDEDE